MAKGVIALAILMGMIVGIAGCNTIAGAGKDVKATGQAIETAAEKAKPK